MYDLEDFVQIPRVIRIAAVQSVDLLVLDALGHLTRSDANGLTHRTPP